MLNGREAKGTPRALLLPPAAPACASGGGERREVKPREPLRAEVAGRRPPAAGAGRSRRSTGSGSALLRRQCRQL